jgi:hypothetical protein
MERMNELIKYLKGLSKYGDNYSPEEALWYAQEAGLLTAFELKSYEIVGERSWGHDSETVYLIDNDYAIRFDIYEMTSHEGDDPDELENIVPVREVEKLVKVWEEYDRSN